MMMSDIKHFSGLSLTAGWFNVVAGRPEDRKNLYRFGSEYMLITSLFCNSEISDGGFEAYLDHVLDFSLGVLVLIWS